MFTFTSQVYRGYGEELESVCKAKFGICAVKTVSEDANASERLHFLIGFFISILSLSEK